MSPTSFSLVLITLQGYNSGVSQSFGGTGLSIARLGRRWWPGWEGCGRWRPVCWPPHHNRPSAELVGRDYTYTARYRNRHGFLHSVREFSNAVMSVNYPKVFVIMGVSWIFEIVSWAGEFLGHPCWLYLPTDCINCLQGVAVFVVFICKKSTVAKALKYLRYCSTTKQQDTSLLHIHRLTIVRASRIPLQMVGTGLEHCSTYEVPAPDK